MATAVKKATASSVNAKPATPGSAGAAEKPAPTALKPAAHSATKVVAPKSDKDKKIKMVRDSIAIPKAEYLVLDSLKLRAATLAIPAKKTEILRAGIKALAAMSDKAFLSAVRSVPNLKTGRPAKGE